MFASMTNCRMSQTALIHTQNENVALKGCWNVAKVNASNQNVVLWPLYLSDLSATVSDVLATEYLCMEQQPFYLLGGKVSWNRSDRQQSPLIISSYSSFIFPSFPPCLPFWLKRPETKACPSASCWDHGGLAGKPGWYRRCCASSLVHLRPPPTSALKIRMETRQHSQISPASTNMQALLILWNPCKSFWSLLIPLLAISMAAHTIITIYRVCSSPLPSLN